MSIATQPLKWGVTFWPQQLKKAKSFNVIEKRVPRYKDGGSVEWQATTTNMGSNRRYTEGYLTQTAVGTILATL